MRNGNSSNMFNCLQCDFTTNNNEELLRHNVIHLIQQPTSQQSGQVATLANIYQNLAQQQHQQQIANNLLAAAAAQQTNNNNNSELMAQQLQELYRIQQKSNAATTVEKNPTILNETSNNFREVSNENNNNMSPSSSAEHIDYEHHSAAESSSSPGADESKTTSSASPNSVTTGGSRKRKPSKTLKVEQISDKLQKRSDSALENAKQAALQPTLNMENVVTEGGLPKPIPSMATSTLPNVLSTGEEDLNLNFLLLQHRHQNPVNI